VAEASSGGFSDGQRDRIETFIRFQVNAHLAQSGQSRYVPALPRAMLSRAKHNWLVRDIAEKFEKTTAEQQPDAIGAKAIVEPLLELSGGNPFDFLKLVLEHRELAASARKRILAVENEMAIIESDPKLVSGQKLAMANQARAEIRHAMDDICRPVRKKAWLDSVQDFFDIQLDNFSLLCARSGVNQ
jgi:hypothetical protein